MLTVLLLTVSNTFMTVAWYGHLRYRSAPLYKVILVSWGIAFFEYCFQVPANRIGWFGGRLALASVGALLIALAAGLGAAIGAAGAGATVSFPALIGAGLNCLPASALFLGAAALLVAVAPRQGIGLAYGLVILAFVWYLVGALLRVPGWLLGVSPFDQIGFVPAVSFRAAPAAVMVALGFAAGGVALVRFRTRDLLGA